MELTCYGGIRPRAEKLMKHKFFDSVASKEHVIDLLIKPLPPMVHAHSCVAHGCFYALSRTYTTSRPSSY